MTTITTTATATPSASVHGPRIWVLGECPESVERLLRECGEHVVYATGRPVHVGDATDIYLVECSPPLACGEGWDEPGAYYEPCRIGARYYPRADADYTRRIVGICPYLPGTPEESLPASIVGRVISELARAGAALPWDSEYVPGLAVGRYFLADSGRYLIGTTDGALYVPPQYVHAEVDLTPEDLTAVETDGTWTVDDAAGGRWFPGDDAETEIAASDDPAATAVRICRETPMRGTWRY